MLTPVEMSRIRVFVHTDFVDDVLKQLATLGAVDISDIRSSLGEFQGLLQPLEPSELLFRASSIQVRASSLIESLGHSVEEASAYEPRWMSAEELEKAESWLSEVEAELSRMRSEAEEDQQALSQALQQLFSKYGEKLLSLFSSLDAIRKIEEAKVKMGKTRSVVVFEGWVPRERLSAVVEAIESATQGYCACAELEVARFLKHVHHSSSGEHEEEVVVQPPTLLRNPKLAWVFEKLTTSFGVPNYYELDPSSIMLVTFPIIFGMMFGDVIHGLILLLGGLYLLHLKRRGVRVGELFGYFVEGSPLIIMCGLSGMVFGFLYGEYLGFSHEEIKWLPGPLWFSPIEEAVGPLHSVFASIIGPYRGPTMLMVLSIFVAMFQINMGLILGVINHLKNKRFFEALAGPGVWLWFYLGGCYLFLVYRGGVFKVVFEDPITTSIYLLLPAFVMLLLRMKLEGVTEGLEVLWSRS